MGVDWSLREGYAWAEDKEHCEEYGRMLQADPSKVSSKAKKRGLPQVQHTVLSCRGRCCIFHSVAANSTFSHGAVVSLPIMLL